jgi:hypothetical protein
MAPFGRRKNEGRRRIIGRNTQKEVVKTHRINWGEEGKKKRHRRTTFGICGERNGGITGRKLGNYY